MTTTPKPRNAKDRLTRGIAAVAIATALGSATYGISTSPGSTKPRSGTTASRPDDSSSPVRSDQIGLVRTQRKAGGTNPLEYI